MGRVGQGPLLKHRPWKGRGVQLVQLLDQLGLWQLNLTPTNSVTALLRKLRQPHDCVQPQPLRAHVAKVLEQFVTGG